MIKVLSAGLYSTIQDLGRFGFQGIGVPYSGAMDDRAARLANALLGNDENNAVIEQTMVGVKLMFEIDTCIAITGAEMQAKIDNKALELNKSVLVNKGSVLSFGGLKRGIRGYIGVIGGFQTPLVLGSRSMYPNITVSHILKAGDELKVIPLKKESLNQHAHLKVDRTYLDSKILEVFQGPEFEFLTKVQQEQLFNSVFHVSKLNNRMAYQLEELLENNLDPILTSGVLPGTVQLTPSGKLIVLMRDCQTTGGYPRVLQLKEEAIAVLGQKKFMDEIKFKLLKY
ncbi:biotin-dependent carboxyltransferase family protein [Gaetbulibacter sp. M240]|uniref:5-oxoprolinase subunit C family protein n=1 Tax=Gaetbulibacter sp. M240 TaxID=3126511 RepID=UPI00374F2241